MLNKLLALFATLLCASVALAAVDVNTATEAELDGIKGIGPGLSGRILEERKTAPFQDWSDFVGRVGGVGHKSAVGFSQEGLTVNGKKFSAAAAAKAEAKSAKKHARSTPATDRKTPVATTVNDAAAPAATLTAPAVPAPSAPAAASATKN